MYKSIGVRLRCAKSFRLHFFWVPRRYFTNEMVIAFENIVFPLTLHVFSVALELTKIAVHSLRIHHVVTMTFVFHNRLVAKNYFIVSN